MVGAHAAGRGSGIGLSLLSKLNVSGVNVAVRDSVFSNGVAGMINGNHALARPAVLCVHHTFITVVCLGTLNNCGTSSFSRCRPPPPRPVPIQVEVVVAFV